MFCLKVCGGEKHSHTSSKKHVHVTSPSLYHLCVASFLYLSTVTVTSKRNSEKMADPEQETPETAEDLDVMFELTKKKKKKKKVVEGSAEESKPTEETDGGSKAASSSSSGEAISQELDIPTYSYTDLLERVLGFVHQNNPELADKKRFTMKPPQLMRVGTKKTLWVNFQEICTIMKRSSDHVFQFMMAELGTEGSIDGMKRLVIRGKFVPKVCDNRTFTFQFIVDFFIPLLYSTLNRY